jgi:DNA gyrase/topoisomerase IV subunit A
MKLPSLERGERVVSFVSWGEEGGTLVMVSRAGRIKHLDLSTVKRLMSQGNRVMGLDEGDRLEAAAVMPPGLEQFLVVTRAGRGVVFDKAGIREQLSRGARGVLRIKSDEDGGTVEVAAILPVQPDCDLVLLGKNGKLLRLKMEAAPMRKAKTAGRRLWKVPVVGAAACSARSRLFVTTRKGRLLLFPASQVSMRTPNRVGVFGIRLESDDAPEMLAAI